jgi:hypothetical protein
VAVTASTSARFRVRVHLRPPSEGGRRRPVPSGYRCNFRLGPPSADGRQAYVDGVLYFDDAAEVAPGSSAIGRVAPALPSSWAGVAVGSSIELCEGPNTVGTAEVLGLLAGGVG